MYFLKTEAAFDSAHFLADYEGKCKNIHGHRWRVAAEICGDRLKTDPKERGMLVDFGDLKKVLRSLCEELDHCLIIERGSLRETTLQALLSENFRITELPFRPTAENLAKLFYEKMKAQGFPVRRISVYESPENCASYEE